MALKDVFQAIALGTPFIFAMATIASSIGLTRTHPYRLRVKFSRWLTGQRSRRMDMRFALIAAFDRLYTSPLLRLKAFIRSAMLSSFVFLGYDLILFVSIRPDLHWSRQDLHITTLKATAILTLTSLYFMNLASVILSDYVSLFVVRTCLFLFKIHPIGSVVLAVAMGGAVIMAFYIILMLLSSLEISLHRIYAPLEFFSKILVFPFFIILMVPAFLFTFGSLCLL